MNNQELATKMAQEAGLHIAVFEKKWKSYDVYYGDFTDDVQRYLGLPYYMLVKNGKIRLSTADEKCELCGLTPMPKGYVSDIDEAIAELENES
ncbi:MAG: hypothetical protein LBS50_00505 [Prevotellaceae bacterium]|jgi:hypothetical protein|nr:hypothetical protein [Prevotellaceae bacterium]